MSDVRVSSSSPSLERMEPRMEPRLAAEMLPKPPTCRNLFGSFDRDELRRELEKQHRECELKFKETWNFDPREERPLPGRMDWHAVPRGAVPEYYSRPCPGKRACSAPSLDVNGNCSDTYRGIPGDLRESGDRRTDSPEHCPGQRKRPNTEDVCPPSKSSKTETDDPPCSSVEQTPSKSSPRRHQT
ncbi:cyclin-dependent kinase inhibitor 1B [Pleurodeles waltl]|uniref:cyclin-dependent kinase inhibitor 1B n=1 Tax=Pleurodeles waltl TaxID=8319 RepID=UPI0037095033